MTRINCIPVTELTDKHLVAEYRELPRLFKLMKAAQDRGEAINDKRNPKSYKLGTGHVRFFYDKAAYLINRQTSLINEMIARGFKPQYTDPLQAVPDGLSVDRMKDWLPDEAAMTINRQRIKERLG